MKVDNFELIRDFLEFKEPTDFYHLQVMLRKKDNPDAPANNKGFHYGFAHNFASDPFTMALVGCFYFFAMPKPDM